MSGAFLRRRDRTVRSLRVEHYSSAVNTLGAMPVKDVASKDVIALHQRLRDTPSMANHVVSMLSKMFSLAERSSGVASEV